MNDTIIFIIKDKLDLLINNVNNLVKKYFIFNNNFIYFFFFLYFNIFLLILIIYDSIINLIILKFHLMNFLKNISLSSFYIFSIN